MVCSGAGTSFLKYSQHLQESVKGVLCCQAFVFRGVFPYPAAFPFKSSFREILICTQNSAASHAGTHLVCLSSHPMELPGIYPTMQGGNSTGTLPLWAEGFKRKQPAAEAQLQMKHSQTLFFLHLQPETPPGTATIPPGTALQGKGTKPWKCRMGLGGSRNCPGWKHQERSHRWNCSGPGTKSERVLQDIRKVPSCCLPGKGLLVFLENWEMLGNRELCDTKPKNVWNSLF